MEIIIQFFISLSTGERALYIILGIYLSYKGVIKVPFIPIGNKYKQTPLDKALKIWMIKTKQTLYEQMNVVEATHSAILFKMKSIYNTLSYEQKDRQHYALLVDSIEKECKSFIRKWCKENHLTSKSATEFNVYKEEKIKFLIELVILELNNNYTNDKFNTTREALQKQNELQLIQFSQVTWNKMFDNIREVSRANEKLISKLEKE